jgi:methylmalonyl-CoA mutase N-terminal domain/subunit
VQEIAFTLANGIAYVEAARNAGLDVNRVGQRLSFFFAAHNDFIEEIAKFRAARRLWAHIMRDRFGTTDPRAEHLRFHAQTAGSTLTAQQPDNNIVRVALQAMAAVLGGAQSLHCNGRDEALALPTEESARLALRTQQIIAAETGVTATVDPVGGAWTVEQRTDRLEEEARRLIDEIDASGGTLRAIERGWIQQQVHESAYAAQRAIDDGTAVIVGVNKYVENTPPIEVFRVDPDVERQQTVAVARLRRERDHERCHAALAEVDRAARSGDNLVPAAIAAVEARATLGEISDTLRRVFGEHHERSW